MPQIILHSRLAQVMLRCAPKVSPLHDFSPWLELSQISCSTCSTPVPLVSKGIATRSLSIKKGDWQHKSTIAKWTRGVRGWIMIFLATLALLLINAAPKTSAALPNFLQDVEEDSTYHKCDSAMCWWTTFDIEVDSDFRLVTPDQSKSW